MSNLFEQMANQGTPLEGQKPNKLASAVNRQVTNNVPAENNPMGIGTTPASEEENQMLEKVMMGIEQQLHGKGRDKFVELLRIGDQPWETVAQTSVMLLKGADVALAERGIDLEPDFWFGENGIIQSTVELVYEVALAVDAPGIDDDDNQLDTAYMRAVQLIGDELFETDDTAAMEAAQEMVDLEFGEGASDLAAEGFELMEVKPDEAMLEDDMLAMVGDMHPEGAV